jgi:chitosanase
MNRRGFLVLGGLAGWSVLAGCRAPDARGGEPPSQGAPSVAGLEDPAHRRVAEAIISSFENSTTALPYAAAHRLDDGRGITAGRAGFTSGTHDLLQVVQRYEAMAGSSTPLGRYLPALQAIDAQVQDGGDGADTTGLDGFEDVWATTSRTDPRLNQAQDAVFDDLYFRPAMDQARTLGLTSALGQLFLLDAAVEHGTENDPDGLPTMIHETTAEQGGGPAPGDRGAAWLRSFLAVRRTHLQHPADPDTAEVWQESIPRLDTLGTLLDQQRFDLATPLSWDFAGQRFQVT